MYYSVSNLDYFKDFIIAKVWALLHDPPNKAWLLSHHVSHEEYARQLSREIFPLKGVFSGIEIPNRRIEPVVKAADRWASSFDRWMILNLESLRKRVISYHNILNIFNPRIVAYSNEDPRGPDETIVREKFACEVRSLLESVINEPVLMYHVLYSALEYVWGRIYNYTCPADTRFPTHTIFDHLYATASMVNWFIHLVGRSEEAGPKGYLVYIDIPGIQQFVNAARKTADYWAGSWLVSYVTWYMAEELIYYLGPDILVLPTARHNLMYRQWLIREVQRICDVAAKKLRDLFGDWYVREPHPVMPATLSIVLPKLDNVKLKVEDSRIDRDIENLNYVLSTPDNLRSYLEGRFRGAFNTLIDAICNLRVNDNYNIDNVFKKLFEKLKSILKKDHLQPPRIVIIDIEETFNEYIDKSESFVEKYLFKEEYEKITNKLKEDLKKLEINEKDILTKLFYHILFSKVLSVEILRHRISRRTGLVLPKAIIDLSKDRYRSKIEGKEEKGLDDRSIGWRYCTVCGQRPAVVSFPRDMGEYDREYDRKICVEILGKSDKDRKCTQLRKSISMIFKPGEHLCTMCLLKRVLRRAIVALDKFDVEEEYTDSNEYIANAVLAEYVLRREFNEERCQRAEEQFDVDVVSSEDVIGRYLACMLIRRRFSYDIGKILKGKRGTNEIKRILRGVIVDVLRRRIRDILRDVPKEYLVMIQGHETPRMYYAIVKGDGDSIGKLIRGELPMTAREYFESIRSAMKYKIPRELSNVYDNVMSLMSSIAEKFKTTILISPAYHASLSAAMMVTAVKDAKIVTDNLGLTVYAGGDDIAALVPVESFLKVVIETRRNYWACPTGFHKLYDGGVLVPALVAYGRSYGVRLAHVMDPMQVEIAIASEALEVFAKDENRIWKSDDGEVRKDSLAVSYGRTSLGELENTVYIPLSSGEKDPYDALRNVGLFVETVKKLWYYMLCDKLSHGLPIDFEYMYRDVVRKLLLKDVNIIEAILYRLISRNVPDKYKDIVEKIMKDLSATIRVVEEHENDDQKIPVTLLVEHVFSLLGILRTFPK